MDARQLFDRDDLKFAKQAATNRQIPIFRVDPEDMPSLRYSNLMPIVVMLKIADPKVLSTLCKEAGEDESLHTVQAQLRASESLASMDMDMFDLVLSESRLDRCCYELAAFVDMYLGETLFEPILDPASVLTSDEPGKRDSFRGFGDNTGG